MTEYSRPDKTSKPAAIRAVTEKASLTSIASVDDLAARSSPRRRSAADDLAAHHPREGTTPMTHTHTATAGYIQTGDTITLPCGEEITVSRWESGPLPGEMSVYYDLPHGADRVILDSHQPIQFHGPATIGRVQRNGG